MARQPVICDRCQWCSERPATLDAGGVAICDPCLSDLEDQSDGWLMMGDYDFGTLED